VVDVISGAECLEVFASLAQSLAGEHLDLGPQAFGYTAVSLWESWPASARGTTPLQSRLLEGRTRARLLLSARDDLQARSSRRFPQ